MAGGARCLDGKGGSRGRGQEGHRQVPGSAPAVRDEASRGTLTPLTPRRHPPRPSGCSAAAAACARATAAMPPPRRRLLAVGTTPPTRQSGCSAAPRAWSSRTTTAPRATQSSRWVTCEQRGGDCMTMLACTGAGAARVVHATREIKVRAGRWQFASGGVDPSMCPRPSARRCAAPPPPLMRSCPRLPPVCRGTAAGMPTPGAALVT